MVRVIVTVLIALLTALVTIVVGTAAAVGAAALRPVPAVFLSAGGFVLLVGGGVGGLVVARRHHLARAIPAFAVGGAVLVGIGAYLAFVPLDDPRTPAAPVEGMEMVDLPSGDRIAYVRLRPAAETGPPIVFVHGGPGVADMRDDAAAFAQLVDDGHELMVYDQVGAGHSERLDDPRDYTLERDVDDLAALIDALELDRPILIGHSYGSTVVAALLARDRDAASKLVFSAPGAIRTHPVQYGTGMVNRLTDGQRVALYRELLEPRALLAWILSQVDPRAARAFATDAELDARFDRTYALSAPGLYCDPPEGIPEPTALGFFANAIQRSIPDLRPALADVDAPALIIKPQCDYLPWIFGTDLRDALPDARLVYLRGAGHSTYDEQPDAFFATVRAFLADEPLPLEPWTSDEPPADLQGPTGIGPNARRAETALGW